jgi:hypothetical protein
VKVKARPAKLPKNTAVSIRLKSTIKELHALHRLLCDDDIDARVLGDFRDALNRIRNTAWAAQQSAANKLYEQGPTSVACLLASERVRAAYQLCRSIREDLGGNGIQFQKGQLAELYGVATQLTEQLKQML